MGRMMSLASAVLAGLVMSLPGVAFGQETFLPGRYAFRTKPIEGCRGIDWDVNIGEGGKLSGLVGWDNMNTSAKLDGTIQSDGKITMHATEVNGSRTATVTGSASGEWVTLTITGTGGPCDGKTVRVPRAGTGR